MRPVGGDAGPMAGGSRPRPPSARRTYKMLWSFIECLIRQGDVPVLFASFVSATTGRRRPTRSHSSCRSRWLGINGLIKSTRTPPAANAGMANVPNGTSDRIESGVTREVEPRRRRSRVAGADVQRGKEYRDGLTGPSLQGNDHAGHQVGGRRRHDGDGRGGGVDRDTARGAGDGESIRRRDHGARHRRARAGVVEADAGRPRARYAAGPGQGRGLPERDRGRPAGDGDGQRAHGDRHRRVVRRRLAVLIPHDQRVRRGRRRAGHGRAR